MNSQELQILINQKADEAIGIRLQNFGVSMSSVKIRAP